MGKTRGRAKAGGNHGRDARGRWLPGRSGNPAGAGPGRPAKEVNEKADSGIMAVLKHDLAIVDAAEAEELEPGQKRPSKKDLEAALNRLARICARRVTQSSESDLRFPEGEVPVLSRRLQELADKAPERLLDAAREVVARNGQGAQHDTKQTV